MALQHIITPLNALSDQQERPHVIGRVMKIWEATIPGTSTIMNVNFVLLDVRVSLQNT